MSVHACTHTQIYIYKCSTTAIANSCFCPFNLSVQTITGIAGTMNMFILLVIMIVARMMTMVMKTIVNRYVCK